MSAVGGMTRSFRCFCVEGYLMELRLPVTAHHQLIKLLSLQPPIHRQVVPALQGVALPPFPMSPFLGTAVVPENGAHVATPSARALRKTHLHSRDADLAMHARLCAHLRIRGGRNTMCCMVMCRHVLHLVLRSVGHAAETHGVPRDALHGCYTLVHGTIEV